MCTQQGDSESKSTKNNEGAVVIVKYLISRILTVCQSWRDDTSVKMHETTLAVTWTHCYNWDITYSVATSHSSIDLLVNWKPRHCLMGLSFFLLYLMICTLCRWAVVWCTAPTSVVWSRPEIEYAQLVDLVGSPLLNGAHYLAWHPLWLNAYCVRSLEPCRVVHLYEYGRL